MSFTCDRNRCATALRAPGVHGGRTQTGTLNAPVYDMTYYGLGARGIDYIETWVWDPGEFDHVITKKFPLYDGHSEPTFGPAISQHSLHRLLGLSIVSQMEE